MINSSIAEHSGPQPGIIRNHPYLASFVICLVVSLIMLAPILLHLDHFFFQFNVKKPPGTDIFPSLWRIWWINKSLTQGIYPFYSAEVFYPIGMHFFFNQAVLWSDFIVFPLVHWLPLIAIHNLVFVLTFILSSWGTFLLVFQLSTNFRAALIGGFIYAFTPFHFAHVDHLTTASYHWIPFFALFFIRMFHCPGMANPLLAALFFALTCLSDLNYGTFLILLGAVFFAYYFLTQSQLAKNKSFAMKFLGFIIGTLLLAGPYAYMVIKTYLLHQNSPGVSITIDSTVSQSLDVLSFFIPSFMHPVFGNWVRPLYFKLSTFNGVKISGFTELVGYLGWSVLFLALLGFRSKLYTDVKLWRWVTATFLVLSLGPVLKCFGIVKIPAAFLHLDQIASKIEPTLDPFALEMMKEAVGIPLPYFLLHFLPLLKANEAPTRFIVLALLGMSVLSAYGFVSLSQKRSSKFQNLCFFIFATILLFEYYSIPSSVPLIQPPPFYQTLADKDPEVFAVVDLPLFGRNPSTDIRYHRKKSDPLYSMETSMAMYYQTFHHKKILVGAPDRRPPELLAFIRANPLLSALADLETLKTVTRTMPAESLMQNQIKYLVLHKNLLSHEEISVLSHFLEKQTTAKLPISAYFEDAITKVYRTY